MLVNKVKRISGVKYLHTGVCVCVVFFQLHVALGVLKVILAFMRLHLPLVKVLYFLQPPLGGIGEQKISASKDILTHLDWK